MSLTKEKRIESNMSVKTKVDDSAEKSEKKFTIESLKNLPGQIMSNLRERAGRMADKLKGFQEKHNLWKPEFQKKFVQRGQELDERSILILKQAAQEMGDLEIELIGTEIPDLDYDLEADGLLSMNSSGTVVGLQKPVGTGAEFTFDSTRKDE